MFGSAMHVWSDLFFALMVPLLPLIKEDMDLSFKEVGLLRLLFTGAAAVLQIPAGFLAVITGEFWLLVLGNAWVAAGLVGMGLAPTFAVLAVSTFRGGLGGGIQHPLGSSMVSRAYDTGGRSTAVGTVNFAGDIGKLVAPALAGGIAVFYGWRTALWLIGSAGILFMVVASMYRRRVAIGMPESGLKGSPVIESENTRMGGFISLSGIGMLDSAARGGALVFLPFVMDDKGLSIGQISALLMFLFAGGAAGKFVCGWLDDRYGSVPLIWGTKGLTALLLVLTLPAPVWAMAPLLLALGVGLNGTSSVLYATVAEFVPASRRARFYGVYYTTNEGSTALAPLCYGVIADLFSLDVTILVMGIATAAILPASLTLIRYLDRKPRT